MRFILAIFMAAFLVACKTEVSEVPQQPQFPSAEEQTGAQKPKVDYPWG